MFRAIPISFLLILAFCNNAPFASKEEHPPSTKQNTRIMVGAEQMEKYLPFLKGKNVGVVANQTSYINNTHLIDHLVAQNVKVKSVFAPEHGFRGAAANGEMVADGKDPKTGLPIISLYGKHKKPSKEDCKNIDVFIFDIQDVGARFYTYISTMHYVMEAAAENNVEVIILDRPNPNGYYIDGPILEMELQSFVGMHPIPVVHGLTVGELAKMINEERWLANQVRCKLTVIPCENYDHSKKYELPIAPSPNLPNGLSIQLYPSLCFFEGTKVSVGRGTDFPFQCFGTPNNSFGSFTFTPKHLPGIAAHPPYENETCFGSNLSSLDERFFYEKKELNLSWLLATYDQDKEGFFKENFFDKLAGTRDFRRDIMAGKNEQEIRSTWQENLNAYKLMRKKYLLYPDFE